MKEFKSVVQVLKLGANAVLRSLVAYEKPKFLAPSKVFNFATFYNLALLGIGWVFVQKYFFKNIFFIEGPWKSGALANCLPCQWVKTALLVARK
jgi:hypothetical protein